MDIVLITAGGQLEDLEDLGLESGSDIDKGLE